MAARPATKITSISAAGEVCDPCRRSDLAWRNAGEDECSPCYRRALELSANALLRGHPAISTGVHCFPADSAAGIAVASAWCAAEVLTTKVIFSLLFPG
jgi:O-acetyl-ADP-ribose deacetylase (regulator of RNase III)